MKIKMDYKEKNKRISLSVKQYYLTEKGINHRRKLSVLQSKRMALYAKCLSENKISNNTNG